MYLKYFIYIIIISKKGKSLYAKSNVLFKKVEVSISIYYLFKKSCTSSFLQWNKEINKLMKFS